MSAVDPRYVAARRVLLDALIALEPHSEALVIAGAQAVYLHTGDGDLAVAPFTTDADLVVDPEQLAPDPLIEAAMTAAGFTLALFGGHVEQGIWTTEVDVAGEPLLVPVDLIVPEAAATVGGRRGARLGVHGRRAARRATGLEAALVDHSPHMITALDSARPAVGPGERRRPRRAAGGQGPQDPRPPRAWPGRSRSGQGPRRHPAPHADHEPLRRRRDPRRARRDPMAGPASTAALGCLDAQFGRRGRPGIELATRAMRLAIPAARVEAIRTAYTAAMLAAAR